MEEIVVVVVVIVVAVVRKNCIFAGPPLESLSRDWARAKQTLSAFYYCNPMT